MNEPNPTESNQNTELRASLEEPFYEVAYIQLATELDNGDSWRISKKNFKAYIDNLEALIAQERAKAVEEALTSLEKTLPAQLEYTSSSKTYDYTSAMRTTHLMEGSRHGLAEAVKAIQNMKLQSPKEVSND